MSRLKSSCLFVSWVEVHFDPKYVSRSFLFGNLLAEKYRMSYFSSNLSKHTCADQEGGGRGPGTLKITKIRVS